MNRRRVFDIIQIGNKSDLISRSFDILIVCNILLNILVLFLQTFEALERFETAFQIVETVTISFFIVEYVLRIWTAEYLFPGEKPLRAVVRFLFSFDGIVDLLTILPFFYLSGFVAFRMLRVVRIFHLFRINATYDSFNVIKAVIYEKRNHLASSLFIILILMLAASLFMYSAEHDAQPDVFRNGFSGIWWSVSTLLTVGYGDIYPVTTTGRILAIAIAFLGVGTVAIPTGIISAGFVEQYTSFQNNGMTDPQTIVLQTVIVDIDSGWIGKTSEEIRQEYGFVILMMRRNDRLLRPDEEMTVQMGDALGVFREV